MSENIENNERVKIPSTYQLFRGNFFALFWDKPLKELSNVPGIQLSNLSEEDREKTLGAYLSGQQLSFSEFRRLIKEGQFSQIKPLLKRFKEICPNPKEAFLQSPSLLNWVPWEIVIAYGEQAKTHQLLERLEQVASGEPYIEEAKEVFPEGAPKKRTEIYIQRQNANAKAQSINEAIANSIDAISGREKIGQFGLGIKQIFSWLEIGKGEVIVTTVNNGQVLRLRAKKGFDERIYLKFEVPEQLPDFQKGTKIEIVDVDFSDYEKNLIIQRIKERFFFVPETSIFIDEEKINGYENITIAGKEEKPQPQGNIRVRFGNNQITIIDDGSGMDKEGLVKMFLPGFGKEYQPLTPQQAEEHVQEKGEVLLIKEEGERKIVFSRNREGVFTIPLPKEALGLPNFSFVLELGKALNVSKGREGLVFDENIVASLPILVKKVIEAQNLDVEQKIGFLNALAYGLKKIEGGQDERHQDEIKRMVDETLKRMIQEIKPFISKLIFEERKKILPAVGHYQKIKGIDFFLHPLFLDRTGISYSQLFEAYGFLPLEKDGYVSLKPGWQIFSASFSDNQKLDNLLQKITLAKPEDLKELKSQVFELMPVVIDEEKRLVIVDQKLYQRFLEENDETKKAFLAETLQILVNPYVYTSYEEKGQDPRVIFFQEKPTTQTAISPTKEKVGLEREVEEGLENFDGFKIKRWIAGDYVFEISPSGVLKRYKETENGLEFCDTQVIPELIGLSPHNLATNDNGCWVVFEDIQTYSSYRYRLVFINKEGQLETLIQTDILWLQSCTVSSEGVVCYEENNKIYIFDPKKGNSEKIYTLPKSKGSYFTPTFHKGSIYVLEEVGSQFNVLIINPIDGSKIEIVNDIPQDEIISMFRLQFIFNENGVFLSLVFLRREDSTIFQVDLENQALVKITQQTFGNYDYFRVSTDKNGRIVFSTPDEFLIFDPKTKTQSSFTLDYYKSTDNQKETLAPIFSQIRALFGGENFSFGQASWAVADEGVANDKIFKDKDSSPSIINKEKMSLLLTLLSSPDFQKKFTSYWQEINQGLSFEEKEKLFQRFSQNVFSLIEVNGEIKSSDLEFLFFTTHPRFFLKLSEEEREILYSYSSLLVGKKKEKLFFLTECLFLTDDPQAKQLFYNQLERLKTYPDYFNDFIFQLKNSSNQELIQATRSPESLPVTSPLRSYLLFLTNKAEIVRDQEEKEAVEFGWQTVLPEKTPLALLAQLYLTDGVPNLEEIDKQIRTNPQIDLSYWQSEIKKAVFSQAAEAGVAKRELLQNAIAAIIASKNIDGEVTVDYYYQKGRTELVEEISDNGTGILNWLAFLLPGVSDKKGVERKGYGFFGSGFFTIFGDADRVEVESAVEREGRKEQYRLVLSVKKDGEGRFEEILIDEFKKRELKEDVSLGTKIKIIRSTERTLAELEAMVGKNTYLSMGGLAFTSSSLSNNIALFFIDENGQKKRVAVETKNICQYSLPFGQVTVVSSALPSMMTQQGLRMSFLSYPPPSYLSLVPKPLIDFAEKAQISVILPGDLPLIEDRSRLANEEEYLPSIRRALATDILKQVTYSLLDQKDISDKEKEWVSSFKMKFPEDIFTNENYCLTFLSPKGEKARKIAEKINNSKILEEEELEWLNKDFNNLLLVLMGIEKERERGKDGFIRRFLLVQEKAGNQQVVQALTQNTRINPQETQVSLPFAAKLESLSSQAQAILEAYQSIRTLEQEEKIETVPITLPEEERQLISSLCIALGLKNLYFVPEEKLKAAVGMFIRNELWLNDILLKISSRERLEKIIHELAHYLEKRASGQTQGVLDTKEEMRYPFTHQQDGDFAYFYRLVNLVLLQIITNQSL